MYGAPLRKNCSSFLYLLDLTTAFLYAECMRCWAVTWAWQFMNLHMPICFHSDCK
jgi:hypothetical protein